MDGGEKLAVSCDLEGDAAPLCGWSGRKLDPESAGDPSRRLRGASAHVLYVRFLEECDVCIRRGF